MDPSLDEKVGMVSDICNVSAEEAKQLLQVHEYDVEVIKIFNDFQRVINTMCSDNANVARSNEMMETNVSNRDTKQKTNTGIMTFQSLNDTDQKKSDDEEGQAFYVGGSEGGGGQQVLGPGKNNRDENRNEFISNIFKNAKESGAEVMDYERVGTSKDKTTKPFSGTAHKLGEDKDKPSSSLVIQPDEKDTEQERQNVVVKLWSNGFSLDDEPLRSFTDPDSADFLRSIQRGQIPQELLTKVKNGGVNVMLEDHRTEDYEPPKKVLKPFSGAGNVLGHPAPPLASSVAASGNAPTVDTSLPTTRLRVTLNDGSRIQVTLNENHTVGDLRRAIVSERSQYAGVPFTLMCTYPKQEFTDDSQSLKDAKLLNVALVQKL